MNTFAVITLIAAFWLSSILPWQVYPYYLKDFFNFKRNFQRLRDYGILQFMGPMIATLLASTIYQDIYGIPLEFPLRRTPEHLNVLSLITVLWLLFILIYYFLVMRKNRIRKKDTKDKSLIEKIDKTSSKINRNLLIAFALFIITSIGEGFFQDLLYVPFIKPTFCQYFGILCEV